ncbi:response regulator transcription factor [Actinokineospora alba]|nr:LuxR C-terminal-related transcriptional regulator [Actinokineospora alba]
MADTLATESMRGVVSIGEGTGTAYPRSGRRSARPGDRRLRSASSAQGQYRGRAGEKEFARAYAAGRAMTKQAAAFALSETSPDTDAKPELLTRRQWEIAALVAEGLSNRHIAEKLVISERTADTHVQNILNKLRLHNRAHIAAWFTERR